MECAADGQNLKRQCGDWRARGRLLQGTHPWGPKGAAPPERTKAENPTFARFAGTNMGHPRTLRPQTVRSPSKRTNAKNPTFARFAGTNMGHPRTLGPQRVRHPGGKPLCCGAGYPRLPAWAHVWSRPSGPPERIGEDGRNGGSAAGQIVGRVKQSWGTERHSTISSLRY